MFEHFVNTMGDRMMNPVSAIASVHGVQAPGTYFYEPSNGTHFRNRRHKARSTESWKEHRLSKIDKGRARNKVASRTRAKARIKSKRC